MPTAPTPRAASSTRLLTQIAVLTALSVLIRRFLTPQVVGLNLGGFPLILSGLVLGPVGGAYVGGISDIVGAWLAPHGQFNLVYTVTAMLTAAVPAAILQARRQPWVPSLVELMIAILAGQMLTKGLLIPLYNEFLSGVPWWVEALKGAAVQLAHVPLYAILALQILKALPASLVAAPARPPRLYAKMPTPGLAMPLRQPYS